MKYLFSSNKSWLYRWTQIKVILAATSFPQMYLFCVVRFLTEMRPQETEVKSPPKGKEKLREAQRGEVCQKVWEAGRGRLGKAAQAVLRSITISMIVSFHTYTPSGWRLDTSGFCRLRGLPRICLAVVRGLNSNTEWFESVSQRKSKMVRF